MKKFFKSFTLLLALALLGGAFISCSHDDDDDTPATPAVTGNLVTFETNGGSTVASQRIADGGTITKPNAPTKTGYKFDAWYKESDCTNTWDFDTDTVSEETTLYAKWNVITYTVTFDANGGANSMSAQSFTVEENGYASLKLTANSFTKSNETFVGWALESSATAATVNDQTLVSEVIALATVADGTATASLTLYAVWTSKATYTLTFDGSGNTSGSMSAQTFIDGESQNITGNAFGKNGYTFAGWAESASGDKVYDDGASASLTANKTIFAVWEPITYTIAFDGNKPSGANANVSGSTTSLEGVKYDEEVTLTSNGFSLTGWEFKGWAKEENGSKEYDDGATGVKNLSEAANETVTLYAVWEAKKYTVTLSAGDNVTSTGTASVEATYDSDMPTATMPEKTGFIFEGYYSEENGSGNQYYNKGGSSAKKWDKTEESVTLYAKWTEITNAAAPTITKDLSTEEVVYEKNATADALKVTASASDNGTLSYQWYSNTSDSTSDGSEIASATDTSYTPPTTTAGTTYYYVVVTNTLEDATGEATKTVTSAAAKITVKEISAEPSFTFDTTEKSLTTNSDEADRTLSITASEGNGTLPNTYTYQWHKSSEENAETSDETLIEGATSADYEVPAEEAEITYYWCIVTNTEEGKLPKEKSSEKVSVTVSTE